MTATWHGPDALKPMLVPVEDLTPDDRNPRRGDREAVARSLDRFGQRKPVVVRKGRGKRVKVIAGNTTMAAAVDLGWTHLAVVDASDLTPDEAQAFALADNRTSDLATYDEAVLADLLVDLDDVLAEAAGYTTDDVDAIVAKITDSTVDDGISDSDEVDVIDMDDIVPRIAYGEVWAIGDHVIMCGDCRSADHVAVAMNGHQFNLAVTSPPYADRRKYDESSEFRPIDPDEYVEWFYDVQRNVAEHLTDDGSWVVNIKAGTVDIGRHLYVHDLVVAHVREWGWIYGDEFCWERPSVPKKPTLRFKNGWEPIYHFARGRWKFRPDNVRHFSANVPIPGGPGVGDTNWAKSHGTRGPMFGAQKRRRPNGTSMLMSDVQGNSAAPGEFIGPGMAYPSNRLPTMSGTHDAVGHPAAFPVGVPAFFIRAYTDPGDVVFDPFIGSGSTTIAAHEHGRRSVGMEISPKYAEIAMRRIEALIESSSWEKVGTR